MVKGILELSFYLFGFDKNLGQKGFLYIGGVSRIQLHCLFISDKRFGVFDKRFRGVFATFLDSVLPFPALMPDL